MQIRIMPTPYGFLREVSKIFLKYSGSYLAHRKYHESFKLINRRKLMQRRGRRLRRMEGTTYMGWSRRASQKRSSRDD